MWASHPEERGSDGGVSPHVCDHMVVPARGVVLAQCNPSGSAVDAGLDATVRALPAARAANSGVLYVQHALHVSPWTPLINAQRVAQFYHYCTEVIEEFAYSVWHPVGLGDRPNADTHM